MPERLNTDQGIQDQVDPIRLRRVARALGIKLSSIPQEALEQIKNQMEELEQSLTIYQEDKKTSSVLSCEFAQTINSTIQRLPSNTPIRDLWSWRNHPLLLPPWTHLMLQLSSEQKKQLGTILGAIIRSVPFGKEEELTLGRLTTNFSLDHIRGLNKLRKAFFIEAFPNNPTEESAVPAIDLDRLKAQLVERGLFRDETEPAKPRLPRMHHPRIPRPLKILERKKTLEIEDELWQYAVEHDLLDKMVGLGKISPDELVQLEYYFKGRPHKTSMPIPKALMDKFSIAVARLA